MEYASIADRRFTDQLKTRWIDRHARSFVFSLLSTFKGGAISVIEDGDLNIFGDENHNLHASIHIRHISAYRALLLGGTVGAADAYIKELWSSPDLLSVVRMFVRNIDNVNKMDHKRPFFNQLASRVLNSISANTQRGSRKNISAHYDLGNDFFELMLDPSMMYSSAIFNGADDDLEAASTNKLDLICQKLQLNKSDHLLEIGTGWGGLAIHAAKHYGCKVTTTTISKKQFEYTKAKIADLGLDNSITLLSEDYRNLRGKYSKLVSIEMIEAVGHEFYEDYFKKCNSLLCDDGLLLIQAITINDQRYEKAKKRVDFIKKYIFPGGCLPSNEEIFRQVSKRTDMQVIQLHDITEHYANTLEHWRNNFNENKDAIVKMGYHDTFCRMWEYYLCYCEGGFRERGIGTYQYLMAKPNFRY